MGNHDDCRLRYKISDEGYLHEMNTKNYDKMREALKAVGIWLDVSDGELRLSIYEDQYDRILHRNAGRKKSYAENKEAGGYIPYTYADIVYMMQTMNNKQIIDKIKMPMTTFYRRKKALETSDYYKSLDKNRLEDKDYLASVPGNSAF